MSIRIVGRAFKGAALALAAALALGSCASLDRHDHDHEHEHEHGYAGRLLISTVDGTLIVAEAEGGSTLATFPQAAGGRAAVYASWTGEFGFALNRDSGSVAIVDSGQALIEHDGHDDLKLGPAAVLFNARVGDKPTHFYSGSGRTGVYNDGSGDIVVWKDDALRRGAAYISVPAKVDHGAPVILEDRMVVGYLAQKDVEILDDKGAVLGTVPGGSRLHGEARFGRFIAFGLVEGVLLVTQEASGFRGRVIPNPAGSPQGARVSTLVANPALPFFVGNFGQGLARIDPVAGAILPVALPANPWRFGIDRGGSYIVALGQDGVLYVFDRDFKPLYEIKLTAPRDPNAAATVPTPRLALGTGIAYVLEPGTNEILEIHLDHGELETRYRFEGTLWDLALMKTDGIEH